MLVYTERSRNPAAGTRYGPGKTMPTIVAGIAGHGVGYAPASDRKSMCTPWISPSSSKAMRTRAVLVARPARRHQVLAPVLDPLHRDRQLRGGEHEAHLLALHEDLLAEATAGVAGDGPDPVLGDAEQPGAEGAVLVRRLRRDPHRHLADAALVLDDDASGLDRHRGVRLLVDGTPR